MCYATVACVTDYDCWHEEHESVTIDMVISNLTQNADIARKIITQAVIDIPLERECGCATALENAIITAPERIPRRMKEDLALLIGKYVS